MKALDFTSILQYPEISVDGHPGDAEKLCQLPGGKASFGGDHLLNRFTALFASHVDLFSGVDRAF